jgi:hypothetical protein
VGVRVERFEDTGEHGVGLPKDVVVPEAEDPISLLTQERRASAVGLGACGVLPAVELDHQMLIRTAEIDDERSDGVLATKLGSEELSVAEAEP